ncbi:MAG: pseudouridine synthase [Blastocatellia bacterium AA13]|nr:MAG: pseudouridine synthase [Blastocatellia bacterium AA13]
MLERLQKIIANAGITSRRGAEELMLNRKVTVNGRIVTELGAKADPQRDHIKVEGKLIQPSLTGSKRYFLVNKTRGLLSAVSDPKQRPLVMEVLPHPMRRGMHPVGRLDYNTEGLIILTNDGDFTKLLTQAGKVEKVYHVKVKGAPTDEQIDRLRRGIRIGGTQTAPARIKEIERTREGGNTWYEVTLTQGRNQQIRRMFDATGHSVTKLRRIKIGHLTDRGLAPGQFRELTLTEVNAFSKPPAPVRKKKPAPRKGALARESSRGPSKKNPRLNHSSPPRKT